jgi:2-isopropylmalate synthase
VDALGDVVIQFDADGTKVSGRGVSTDVVEASARAFLNAVNKVLRIRDRADVREMVTGP